VHRSIEPEKYKEVSSLVTNNATPQTILSQGDEIIKESDEEEFDDEDGEEEEEEEEEDLTAEDFAKLQELEKLKIQIAALQKQRELNRIKFESQQESDIIDVPPKKSTGRRVRFADEEEELDRVIGGVEKPPPEKHQTKKI